MADKKTNKPFIVLWEAESKAGRKYLESKFHIAFYNAPKEDPKHPDLRVYKKDDKGSKGEELASLWVKVSEKGTKYLSGQLAANKEIYLTGFINTDTTGKDGKKLPKVRIFKQSDLVEAKVEETKKEDKKGKKQPIPSDDELPF